MALTSSGQIKISEIATEHGGSAPHGMSEYYRGGSVGVQDFNSGVPTSGEIALSDFYDSYYQAAFSSSSTYGSLLEVGRAMAVTSTVGLTNVSTNVNSTNIGSWDYTIRSGETISSFSSSTYFSSQKDTRGTFITWKGDLTINSGQTFIPSERKLWTCLYVDGDLTINGGISMTKRGANHSGSGDSAGSTTAAAIRIATGTYSSVSNPQIPATGGAGVSGGSAGNAGTNGGTGSGSGGGGGGGNGPGSGSAGTSFSGGTGGGGNDNGSSSGGVANGGKGGNAGGESSGAGAGNPVGNDAPLRKANAGESGTGGVLVIFCTGTVSGSGLVEADGARGGWHQEGRGGGGSGGGSVTILCGTNSFSGTVRANAAAASSGGYQAGAGTARILTGL